jgi:hypothetical protein
MDEEDWRFDKYGWEPSTDREQEEFYKMVDDINRIMKQSHEEDCGD